MDKKYKLDIENIHPLSTSNIVMEENNIIVDNVEGEQKCTFDIVCDDIADTLSFTVENYGDDDSLSFVQDRCNITVYIKPNLTENDKMYTLIFSHSNDVSVYKQITFIQTAKEFKIVIDESDNGIITEFDAALDEKNSNGQDGKGLYYQERTFKVKAIGGSEKWRVRSIMKVYPTDYMNEVYEKFDNDFVYIKDNDSFIIKSYGKPCIEKNAYYIVTLCHNDNKEIINTIIVNYPNVSYKEETQHKEDKDTEINDKGLYSIGVTPPSEGGKGPDITYQFYKSLNDDGITYKEYNDIEVGEKEENSFSLIENGVESKRKCRIYSSAVWCRAILNEKEEDNEIKRSFTITTTNKALKVRRSYIKVMVIDKPSVYFYGYVVDKP